MSENNFDFSEILKQFDVAAMTRKLQEGFNLDLSAVNESQSKNIESMINANKSMAEGTQAIMKMQADMISTAMTEAMEAAKSLADSGSPQEVAEKQSQIMKSAYETAVKNTSEISELVQQTQQQVSETISARVAEALEEIKSSVSKLG